MIGDNLFQVQLESWTTRISEMIFYTDKSDVKVLSYIHMLNIAPFADSLDIECYVVEEAV